MQTAGDLIAAAAELTAGVEDGVHDGCRRDALFWVDAHRDASAVIRNTDHVFRENVHGDLGAESCQRLINGVIYDLIDQMMQSLRPVEPMYIPGRFRTASSPSST